MYDDDAVSVSYRMAVRTYGCHPETCSHTEHLPYWVVKVVYDANRPGLHKESQDWLVGFADEKAARDLADKLNAGDIIGSPLERAVNWLRIVGEGAASATPLQLLRERTARFLEEAIELVCATACLSQDEVQSLVNYVYNQPLGKVGDEVGDVVTTFNLLAAQLGVDPEQAFDRKLTAAFAPRKLAAIREKFKYIRETGSVLPMPVTLRGKDRHWCAECKGTGKVWDVSGEGPWTCYACHGIPSSALRAQVNIYHEALSKLACLGNGNTWGNSDGNLIAQAALKTRAAP